MWGAIAAGVLTIGSSMMGSRSAKKKEQKIAGANVELIEKETTEDLRRMDEQKKQMLGGLTGAIGASGVKQSGSLLSYKDATLAEANRQADWRRLMGQQQVKIARLGGGRAVQQVTSQRNAGVASGIGQIASAVWT